MFQPSGKQAFIVAVFLLAGAFAAPAVHADIIKASQIDGEYGHTDLGNQQQSLPVNFNLTQGVISDPARLIGLLVPASLSVSIDAIKNVDLGSNFTLSAGESGFILYSIRSSTLASSTEIDSNLTLLYNTTSIDTSDLTQPMLILTFPNTVNLDPDWSGFSGPVTFSLAPVPEPVSVVHLTWVGALAVVGYWRRHRRAPRALTV